MNNFNTKSFGDIPSFISRVFQSGAFGSDHHDGVVSKKGSKFQGLDESWDIKPERGKLRGNKMLTQTRMHIPMPTSWVWIKVCQLM